MNLPVTRLVKLLFGYVVIMSLLLVFLIPPFQKTDEVSHFYKTISVATGQPFCQTTSQGQQSNQLSEPYYSLPAQLFADFVNKSPQNRFPRHSLIEVLKGKPDFSKSVSENISCSLPFIFYLPVALFLALPVYVGVNPLITFYLGRLAFCLLGLGLFYVAKKNLPAQWQLLLLVMFSLPMTLVQIGSYNKEVILLGFGALSFSLLIQVRQHFSWQRFLGFVFSLIVCIAPRPQFAPLLVLVFLGLPTFHLKALKRKFGLIMVVLVAVLASLAFITVKFYLPKVIQLHTPNINSDGVAPSLQILYLQKFPLQFPSILFDSYTNHIDAYYKSLIGTFGSIHSYLDWYVYSFYGVVLVWVIYHYSKLPSPFKKYEWLLIAVALGLTFFLTFLSLYIYATPVGFHYVVDVQGRYFIMLLPYLLLFCAYVFSRLQQKIVLVGFILMMIFLLKNVYDRYYDYRANFYASDPIESFTKVKVDQKLTNFVSVDSTKKFRGLAFFSDKFNGGITIPYTLTIYDESCQKQLGLGLMKTYLYYKASALIEVPIDAVLTNRTQLCYTLEPLGQEYIKNNQPLYLKSDSQTNLPVARPLYDY